MPEPDPIPRPVDPEPSTTGWEPEAEYAPTITRSAGSTPGPYLVGDETRTGSSDNQDFTLHRQVSGLPEIPGYRLLGVLGRGGMGTVYRAIHVQLNRVVALKIINPGGRDESSVVSRFEREVKSLARIEHPNIVTVFDAGSWQGFPFYTMKLVPGGTLSKNLPRIRGDLRSAIELMVKVARAVHALHTAGVLHRDLKPLNILLGVGDEPFVADFGLALFVDDDSDLSATGTPLGTRQYMPPEQTLGRKSEYAPACDVWALGVILYEVLTGRRPFQADDPIDLYRQIRFDDPPPCGRFAADVPRDLEAIARNCLAKQPAGRYASAAAVADDLERWLGGESVVAPKLPPARKRWWKPAALVGAVCLIAIGVVATRRDPPEQQQPSPAAQPERSVAERLKAGETVTLVDATGKLLVPHRVLPECNGTPIQNRAGLLSLNSAGLLAVELIGDPLPLSVRFEADYALVIDRDDWSGAGVFVGYKETAGKDRALHTMFQVAQRSTFMTVNDAEEEIAETARVELRSWARPEHHGRDEYGSQTKSTRVPIKREPTLSWHTVAVTIRPTELAAEWDGRAFKPLAETETEPARKLLAARHGLASPAAFGPSMIGPGIGLCVENAEAVFRNVRIVPLNP